jgi:acyl dehydratase
MSRGHNEVAARWSSWAVGDRIPSVSMAVTLQRLVVAAGGERDFNPLHVDEAYARSCGFSTAFANGFFQQAMLDRTITDFTGSSGELRRLSLRMRAPVYLGRSLEVTGAISSLAKNGSWLVVELDLQLSTEDGLCSTGAATVRLPLGE